MNAIDDELFDTIINGPYIPTKLAPTTDDPNKITVQQRVEWIETEKKLVRLDKESRTSCSWHLKMKYLRT